MVCRLNAITDLSIQHHIKELLQNTLGTIDNLTTQIHQMRGLFNDEDGTIADALDDAEDAVAQINDFMNAPPAPREPHPDYPEDEPEDALDAQPFNAMEHP